MIFIVASIYLWNYTCEVPDKSELCLCHQQKMFITLFHYCHGHGSHCSSALACYVSEFHRHQDFLCIARHHLSLADNEEHYTSVCKTLSMSVLAYMPHGLVLSSNTVKFNFSCHTVTTSSLCCLCMHVALL